MLTILVAEGYEGAACDAREGLETALREPPDLILLDLYMPGLDGPQIADELRRHEQTKAIPIVIVSAFHDAAKWFRSLTPAGVLQKPFSLEDFVTAVRAVIGPATQEEKP
jgi:two-component system phosphate regulon response regulator PhoB